MSLLLLRGALEQGLLYALVALGLYISFRVLGLADLTVDGSFTLGAAVAAVLTLAGHPWLGLVASLAAGALAGLVTALLQTKLKVQSILAGIITMTGLYSINLRVMGGRSNLALLRSDTPFTLFGSLGLGPWSKVLFALMLALVVCLLLALFLRTRLGLSVRATGDNAAMVSASSINPQFTTAVGLMVANSLVALSGALVAGYQKFADISMGTGMVVIGLASLIIGEVLLGAARRPSVARGLAAALVGGVIYWLIIALALSSSLSAGDLKLVSAVIVACSISWPALKNGLALLWRKKHHA